MSDELDRLKAALADKYAIDLELGRGRMATVYLAEDLKHHRRVAVKVLRPELAATLGPERFLREIRIAANLNHPHIVSVYDSGDANGDLYYVMPYIDGESLRDRITRTGPLPIEEALRLTGEVARALSYSHDAGVIHRDIKPENILLHHGEAMVTDFGIAKAVSTGDQQQLTATGFAVGTPAYMSPEQAAGDELDGRADLYSLACVLFEALSGQLPFSGTNLHQLMSLHVSGPRPHVRDYRHQVPDYVDAAIHKAMGEIGLRVSQSIYLNTFIDAGNVWARSGQFNPTRLFRGAGFGVAMITPLGPIGLDYAYGFDRVDLSGRATPKWKLHFRLGNFF